MKTAEIKTAEIEECLYFEFRPEFSCVHMTQMCQCLNINSLISDILVAIILRGRHHYMLLFLCFLALLWKPYYEMFPGPIILDSFLAYPPVDLILKNQFGKIKFDELDFLSISNLIFTACVTCKNPVWSRLFKLEISKIKRR